MDMHHDKQKNMTITSAQCKPSIKNYENLVFHQYNIKSVIFKLHLLQL